MSDSMTRCFFFRFFSGEFDMLFEEGTMAINLANDNYDKFTKEERNVRRGRESRSRLYAKSIACVGTSGVRGRLSRGLKHPCLTSLSLSLFCVCSLLSIHSCPISQRVACVATVIFLKNYVVIKSKYT